MSYKVKFYQAGGMFGECKVLWQASFAVAIPATPLILLNQELPGGPLRVDFSMALCLDFSLISAPLSICVVGSPGRQIASVPLLYPTCRGRLYSTAI